MELLQYTPVRTPQFKASVERMFGSLTTMFFHALPGTMFSNPGERGGYNSAEQACVYLSDVDKMLNIFHRLPGKGHRFVQNPKCIDGSILGKQKAARDGRTKKE